MPGRQKDSKMVEIKQLGCEDSRVRLHPLSGRWKENSQIRLDPCDTGSKVEAAHLQQVRVQGNSIHTYHHPSDL